MASHIQSVHPIWHLMQFKCILESRRIDGIEIVRQQFPQRSDDRFQL